MTMKSDKPINPHQINGALQVTNGKLRKRIKELEEENKELKNDIELMENPPMMPNEKPAEN